jgi:predicted ferric reductase
LVAEKVLSRGRHDGPARRSGLRFGWADLLGPVGVASVVAVVCLWVRNEGAQTFDEGSRVIGSAGLLTGLLASDLMVLQVVMMARIPWVERAWGHDLLARRHRWVGFASFWLMVMHVGLFAAERLSRDDGAGWSRLTTLFLTDPWMLFATLGTAMLIGVVVTSVRRARRRLRYESWHLLHLYAYLGIALSFPHQLSDGAEFHDPAARIYWWTLYLSAAVATLVWRVGVPLWRSTYHRMRVAGVSTEVPGVVSVAVEGHRLDRLRTKSGQFFIWRFRDGPGWTRGNPYTISAAPRPDRLRVTIQVAGDGSARAAALRTGTRVLIEGPYGTLTADRRRHPRMLLVAAGVGITPLRALLEDAPYEPGETALIYRFTAAEHAIFTAELTEIARRRGVELHFLPGSRRADGSWLPAGLDLEPDDVGALTSLVPDVADRDIFVCGPSMWISSVRRALRSAGVDREQIQTEEFAW